jgi:hypothetical protein
VQSLGLPVQWWHDEGQIQEARRWAGLHAIKLQAKKSPRWGLAGLKH